MRERGGVEVGKDNNIMFSITLLPPHGVIHSHTSLYVRQLFLMETGALLRCLTASCGASNSGRSGISSSRSSCM